VKGPDPKLLNEFYPQVSPSQVRDASGPHDSKSNRFRWRSFSATMWSRRSLLQLPTQRPPFTRIRAVHIEDKALRHLLEAIELEPRRVCASVASRLNTQKEF
jgi:hypothetical protein